MRHDPRSAVLDMVVAIERAVSLGGGTDEREFVSDERAHWAVYSQIVILGEAASRLPREFCETHPDVPWSSAIGMRHRLVHGYDSVDWHRVWRTLKEDLPPLLIQLRALLPEDENES